MKFVFVWERKRKKWGNGKDLDREEIRRVRAFFYFEVFQKRKNRFFER